ncbi:MAG: heavy-metal-associated domain-containing protein [Rhodospirillales bacterium]|nr:heavy-metal-associated domain-containing protein [Rhodospirillales bacterium]
MQTTTFRIDGMHCDGCAETVRTLLEREPGVKAVAVSFATAEARVLHDPVAAPADHLAALIRRPGFQVVGQT